MCNVLFSDHQYRATDSVMCGHPCNCSFYRVERVYKTRTHKGRLFPLFALLAVGQRSRLIRAVGTHRAKGIRIDDNICRSMGRGKASAFAGVPAIMHWFRRDLRVGDNHALNAALAAAASTRAHFVPIFILDPDLHNPTVCGAVRMRFVLESIDALRGELHHRCGARLRVVSGRPSDVLPPLIREWRVSKLCYEIEHDPAAVVRDASVAADARALGAQVVTSEGFTVYELERLLSHAKPVGKAPANMSGFLSLIERAGDPLEPVEFADGKSISLEETPPDIQAADGRAGRLTIPTLSDMGYDEDELRADSEIWERFRGGEAEGWKRMDAFLAREGGRVAARFSKPETSPGAFEVRETTVLSPYLALGCVSSRGFHKRLRELESKHKVSAMPQTRLWGQLMWRESFWLLAATTPNFHKMVGNPICRQIDWDTGPEADSRFAAWSEARTGLPWIDALLTQLVKEGFVHHLGRHSLACFLTRGDLWVSWERGAKVFERYLIDYDYALNSANWMWLSASAFFNTYFRVYSPVAFAKKWDQEGKFIKHYLPVLSKMPTRYVHEPWKAPLSVQRAAGCVIGVDYPAPIVDHGRTSKENIGRMKVAYARGLRGVPEDTNVGAASEKKSNKSDDNDDDLPQARKSKRIRHT